MKRGRLIRRLKGEEAHSVCLLPAGVVMTWNQSLHAVSIFTLNGIPVGSAQLPSSCSISCMEMSADGENALTVVNKSVESAGLSDGYRDFSSRKFKSQEDDHQKVDKADRRFRYFPAFNLFPLFTFALYLNEKNKFHWAREWIFVALSIVLLSSIDFSSRRYSFIYMWTNWEKFVQRWIGRTGIWSSVAYIKFRVVHSVTRTI